jgi:cellulose synthase/poly-beta-1,6-N-acetylglucosamine synthase-like glycosyltransferase
VSRLRNVGLAVGWGVALLWATRTLVSLAGISRLPDLTKGASAPRPRGRLSVIVPARDEGAGVEEGLRSLLAQRDVALEVIAVDDRSSDQTGAVMDALAVESETSRVRCLVEHVRELPQGWLGKPHAMAQGVRRGTGEWLLFTDADVVFAPDALSRALAYLEREGADHLLLLPTVVARSMGERMMLPLLNVLSIWGPRLWRVADPKAKDSVGVGAFNLMRRSTYDAVGGWERLRMEVIEDLRIGVLIKQAGYASRVVTGRNLVRIRWANGAWGVVENLTKNVYAAFRFNLGMMLVGVLCVAVLCLLPFAGLAWSAREGRWIWPSSLSVGSLVALYWRYRGYSDPNDATEVLWVLTFPAATLLFLYALLRSTALTLARQGVVWRGTFYPLRELRAHAGPLR